MEFKWTMIALTVTFGSLFTGLSIKEYQVNQCRIASIQAGKTADDIVKICK